VVRIGLTLMRMKEKPPRPDPSKVGHADHRGPNVPLPAVSVRRGRAGEGASAAAGASTHFIVSFISVHATTIVAGFLVDQLMNDGA